MMLRVLAIEPSKGGKGGNAGISLGINDKGATPLDVTP